MATSAKQRHWVPQWARRTGLVLVTVLIVEYFVLPSWRVPARRHICSPR